ncbi:MAG: sugar phosphate isomerase/epimerase [Pedosphaera sp.]|nr:sugar phosphate isomerase/epimerase [Pedosphaera sp.]
MALNSARARRKYCFQVKTTLLDRLAVCSWSLQPANPNQLIQQMQEIGLKRMQCALDPVRENPAIWGNLPDECAKAGIDIVSGMFGCVGEDYSTMDSIRRTGGIVPDSNWDENWKNIQAVAQIAKKMDLKLISFHAGFLPHDEKDPAYKVLLERLRLVADIFATNEIDLALETGQEGAETLKCFLEKLSRANVGVNFDPANMILYQKGDPIEALQILGPWLKQCHIKDAAKTLVPGTWGEEMVAGMGEVVWADFFETLEKLKFGGYLCIEREAGSQRVQDIRAARLFVEKLSKTDQGK